MVGSAAWTLREPPGDAFSSRERGWPWGRPSVRPGSPPRRRRGAPPVISMPTSESCGCSQETTSRQAGFRAAGDEALIATGFRSSPTPSATPSGGRAASRSSPICVAARCSGRARPDSQRVGDTGAALCARGPGDEPASLGIGYIISPQTAHGLADGRGAAAVSLQLRAQGLVRMRRGRTPNRPVLKALLRHRARLRRRRPQDVCAPGPARVHGARSRRRTRSGADAARLPPPRPRQGRRTRPGRGCT